MPIIFLNNYTEHNLEKEITKKDGTPLWGEIWLYKQFLKFNASNLLPNETWYLKHDYNLSTHPASKGKVEGQVDYILLSKYGVLIIEIKGGGLRVDENDLYYSYDNSGEYQTQNPFNQAKEYTHTIKGLIDSSAFIYRAVILPHEAGFKLKGPQLEGYKELFFSKNDFEHLIDSDDENIINKIFFDFIYNLGKASRSKIIKELYPNLSTENVNNKRFEKYPELTIKKIKQLKAELFPIQTSYGYNPNRINSEIILNENYEILKGLRRNQKVLIQGGPGTGKTVLAKKFLAENLLKQHKGIIYCANKLMQSRLEYIMLRDYNLDSNLISFEIFTEFTSANHVSREIDFVIFDEAQEYFNKGLFEFIECINNSLENPKLLLLYDPQQTIISNFNDIAFYTDYYIENGFTHYFFDEQFRGAQNKEISIISNQILTSINLLDIKNSTVSEKFEKLSAIKGIISESIFTNPEKIVLIHSRVFDDFDSIAKDYFKNELEELTETNINISSSKIRYTTPIKYRGLENKSVYLITDELSEKSKVQNYVAVTRAMENVKIIIWKI